MLTVILNTCRAGSALSVRHLQPSVKPLLITIHGSGQSFVHTHANKVIFEADYITHFLEVDATALVLLGDLIHGQLVYEVVPLPQDSLKLLVPLEDLSDL